MQGVCARRMCKAYVLMKKDMDSESIHTQPAAVLDVARRLARKEDHLVHELVA
jgi:hypothetical protein